MWYRLLFLLIISPACGDASTLFANRMPQAFAGFDQTIAQGSSLTLDGSRSFDPDDNGLIYRWSLVRQIEGVSLSSTTGAQVELIADASAQGSVTIALEVNDGPGWSWPDWVTIRVVPEMNLARPTANAGANRHMRMDEPVILDGGASRGNIDTYRWVHLLSPAQDRRAIDDGITALISDLEPGLHVFGLSVASADRWSIMDCLSIYVSNQNQQEPFPSIDIEEQTTSAVTLLATSTSDVVWSLISGPNGESNQLEGTGDNRTRLEYRSDVNGMHLFAATLSNGLSDWIAVELENNP